MSVAVDFLLDFQLSTETIFGLYESLSGSPESSLWLCPITNCVTEQEKTSQVEKDSVVRKFHE